MDQTNNGFRTNESLKRSFTHSCLGRLVICAAVLIVVLIIAHLSVPDKETMTYEIEDDIMECIQTHDNIQADKLDDAIDNIGRIFTVADSTFDQSTWRAFLKYNRLVYHKHAFYSTMHLHNNLHPDGDRFGIGIFGIVIPTVTFSDIILNINPIHKGYDRPIQTPTFEDSYMGEQPHIKEYHYQGDVTQ